MNHRYMIFRNICLDLEGCLQCGSVWGIEHSDHPILSEPACGRFIFDGDPDIRDAFDKDEYSQKVLLCKPKPNPETSLRVVPVQSSFITNEETCPALQARLVSEIDPTILLIPLVTSCRAHKCARPMSARLAYITVHLYVCFFMYVITDQVKDVINDHARDFPPFIRSEITCFRGTVSFTASQPRRPNFFRGFPSDR
jgi:hypothetical protein